MSHQILCDTLARAHASLTLGQFSRQADTNIALTAAESPFWGISDVMQTKQQEVDHELAYSTLWVHLCFEILCLCANAQSKVHMPYSCMVPP